MSHGFPHPIPPLPIAQLLRQAGLHPKKRLGQNFLQDPHLLEAIVQSAEISPTDWVLEIGPGLGSLTRYLANAARQVVAVEIDDALFQILEQVLAPWENVQLVRGDILRLSPADLIQVEDYLVVANIPYYITSAVIRHLLEAPRRPRRMVLTVQKEVAERICAQPKEMNLLALSVQVYGHPSVVLRIPAGSFYPMPKVDSAVVRLDLYRQPYLADECLETFFRLIHAGFSQKRKTLRNALAHGLGVNTPQVETLLLQAGIDPQRRAETLSLDEWGQLVNAWKTRWEK
ncbi:MAG: 16S rRNA (adenine(1518)-N(6)/adenine(1519)-N(6))-dimethyltransferase RsmA [Anaerolineales bacterium]